MSTTIPASPSIRRTSAALIVDTGRNATRGLSRTGTTPDSSSITAERRDALRVKLTPASKAIATAPPSADSARFTEQLRDGTHVIIRPLDKDDVALERAFIKRLSPESRRMRFLGQISEPSDDMIHSLTDIDYRKDMAFVALVHRDNEKREIGVSRYSVSADGQSCECAVAVDDEWHEKGLGSLLMSHLIDVARARGIRAMISFDDANNWQMRDLATYLGFRRERDPGDSSQVIHRLTL